MYRIFCESYANFTNDFEQFDARLAAAEPLGLIVDVDKFNSAKKGCTEEYKRLCDLLHFASQNIGRYPRMEAFLWTISSRGMLPESYGASDSAVMEEQVKLIDSFLKLAYWH
ncbi:MAG: hypothetical protein FWG42_09930 [Clostridiales bacterium]|nr:hypothetical protein [Clostridiales bacterium]